jgi:predicted transcriptional regulator
MKTKRLTQLLERIEAWPADAQDALADIAHDIDESLTKGDYVPTPAELAGIDRGLRDAEAGRFATEAQVDAALAKLRHA